MSDVNAPLLNVSSLFDLEGKVALVTGGAKGLGRMIADALVAAHCTVYITSRDPKEGKSAADEMVASGGRCIALPARLATAADARALVSDLGATISALHILVNNAGSSWGAPLDAFPEEKWNGVMGLNVSVPFFLIQNALPLLSAAARQADPARIVNIGSVAGLVPSGNSSFSYDVSKAALHHLTRVLAAELAPRHMTVNAIAPGYFPSKMTGFLRANETRLDQNLAKIPLGRWGNANEIGGLMLYLCGRAGAYTTGSVVPLDGGLSIR